MQSPIARKSLILTLVLSLSAAATGCSKEEAPAAAPAAQAQLTGPFVPSTPLPVLPGGFELSKPFEGGAVQLFFPSPRAEGTIRLRGRDADALARALKLRPLAPGIVEKRQGHDLQCVTTTSGSDCSIAIDYRAGAVRFQSAEIRFDESHGQAAAYDGDLLQLRPEPHGTFGLIQIEGGDAQALYAALSAHPTEALADALGGAETADWLSIREKIGQDIRCSELSPRATPGRHEYRCQLQLDADRGLAIRASAAPAVEGPLVPGELVVNITARNGKHALGVVIDPEREGLRRRSIRGRPAVVVRWTYTVGGVPHGSISPEDPRGLARHAVTATLRGRQIGLGDVVARIGRSGAVQTGRIAYLFTANAPGQSGLILAGIQWKGAELGFVDARELGRSVRCHDSRRTERMCVGDPVRSGRAHGEILSLFDSGVAGVHWGTAGFRYYPVSGLRLR